MTFLKALPVILINYLPFLYIGSLIYALFLVYNQFGVAHAGLSFLIGIYLLPPLITRTLVTVLGEPKKNNPLYSKGYFLWWTSAQFQIFYLRFPFLEEALRMVPGLYSAWLRLWGAKIGKFVYWGPQLRVMDRPFIEIGDFAVIGYGAGFTSHHVQYGPSGELELIFGKPKVMNRAVMGGMSGLAPGAILAEKELLPSTKGLAPFYEWRGGRGRPTREHSASKEIPV